MSHSFVTADLTVTQDIRYIGVNDREIDLFEGQELQLGVGRDLVLVAEGKLDLPAEKELAGAAVAGRKNVHLD